ncbi:MAG TPA: LacI family DNA-binding transcriptional regulator [Capsulimonadaceae bacterium]|jgi:DNA-binding LacI/PurR family transcriptional regulator
MPVTIRDIAKNANVSHVTVSHILNRKPGARVSDATRQRVLLTAEEMGYQPNRLARALVTGQTNIIALWIVRPHRPFFARIAERVRMELRRDGYDVIISDVEQDEGYPTPSDWPVDGVLAAPRSIRLNRYMEIPAAHRAPVTVLDIDPDVDWDGVAVETAPAVRQANEHLLAVGCRRVAYVVHPEHLGRPHHQVYEAVMREAGITPELILPAEETRPAAAAAIIRHVADHGCPDGLFCRNDDIAIGAMRSLYDLGKRIPEDVAIVGHDGIEDTEFTVPRLTTVQSPVDDMVAVAWRFLRNRMENRDAPRQIEVLRSKLIIRESTRR